MILHLHELEAFQTFWFTEKDDWFRNIFLNLGIPVKGPIHLTLEIYKNQETISMKGHLQAACAWTCDRCAEEASWKVDEFFSPTFIHGKEPRNLDIGVAKSELDTTYFQKNHLELKSMMMEQVELLKPVQFLCQEQCRGLCQQCGHNLNKGICACKETCKEKESISSSGFHVLKNFKLKKS
ncbi:MAG: DUF177 domain-containing protein [Deltaproteobacteria bacterium]|nr:DUF177 domain-containing protein [Deltaproteobacteria bacterium]